MPKSKVTFDTVRKIAQTLPGTEDVTAYGSPAIKVRGTLMACIPVNKAAEHNSLIRIIAIVFLALLPAGRDALAQTDDSTVLVRTVLDKQKTRPFWFRLRRITFGYVPYVFDVRTKTEKYDGKGGIKGDGPQDWSSGVFTPVEGVLLYTPTDFFGKEVPEREQKEWEEFRKEQAMRWISAS